MGQSLKFFPLVIFATIWTSSALGQQSIKSIEEPKTKLESFQKQVGSVVIKGYSEIGKVGSEGYGSILITAMEVIDASSQEMKKGIVIEVLNDGKYRNSVQSFLDYEEITPLIVGIEYKAEKI